MRAGAGVVAWELVVAGAGAGGGTGKGLVAGVVVRSGVGVGTFVAVGVCAGRGTHKEVRVGNKPGEQEQEQEAGHMKSSTHHQKIEEPQRPGSHPAAGGRAWLAPGL